MTFLSAGLNLTDKSCAVIGGGKVGYRKAMRLLEAGAYVDVYSQSFSDDFLSLSHKRCKLYQECFFDTEERYFLVVAATNSEEDNNLILKEAHKRGALVNHVGDKILSDIIFMSDLTHHNLSISLGTNGLSPEFSRHLRMHIEKHYLNDWAEVLEIYERLRELIHLITPDKEERLNLLRKVNFESILNEIKESTQNEIIERTIKCLLY